jgi:hypothetical protein
MNKNMGNLDRIIRIIMAIIIGSLYLMEYIGGFIGLILIVLSVVFIVTSILQICPIYSLIRISTRSSKKN